MRIAFITFEYPPYILGGAGIYAKNLTEELGKLGNEVHIITPYIIKEGKEHPSNGIYIHRLRIVNKPLLRAPSFWVNLWKQFRVIEKKVGGFDIVHENGAINFRKGMVNSPRVLTVHHLAGKAIDAVNPGYLYRFRSLNKETGLIAPYIEKICIKQVDKIIAVSNHTKKTLISTYGIPNTKIKVIYNGVEQKNFNYSDEEKKEIKKEFALSAKPIIMFVGRVDDKRKGVLELLKAFRLVLRKMDCILLILGSGDQNPCKRFASSLGIEDNVVFTGFVDDLTLRKLYSICDVFVSFSKLEGFGFTLAEAMAAGKPVVATNVGAIPEIIKDGENGILVELWDVNGFSDAICTYLENKKVADDVGKKNAEYAKKKFSWKITAKRYNSMYQDCIKSTTHANK